jgi:dCMP deaminase
MGIVLSVAENSRCLRGVKKIKGKYERDKKGKLVGQTRKFGCIIVNRLDKIDAHGFNAEYPSSPKCEEAGCLREQLSIPSGEQLEKCRAMHAEWWAVTNLCLSGSATGTKGATMYLNAEPCEICAKIITGLGLEAMVLLAGVYPTNGTQIVRDAGVNVRYIEME